MGDVKPKYLIRKHGGYYRQNSRGYTTSAIQAGRYTLEEAQRISHPNGVDGPHDGMSYINESGVYCEDWRRYAALKARVAALEKAMRDAGDYIDKGRPHMAQNIIRNAIAALDAGGKDE